MYVDNNLIVSGGVNAAGVVTAQSISGASAVVSANSVDLSQPRDVGEGQDLFLRVEVIAGFTGLTAMDIEAITADDAALTTNVTSIGSVKGIPVANLGQNARFAVDLSPQIASKGRRYLGARFTPTGTGTGGSVFADFGIEIQDGAKNYPVGYTII